jgi:hypothetical protein
MTTTKQRFKALGAAAVAAAAATVGVLAPLTWGAAGAVSPNLGPLAVTVPYLDAANSAQTVSSAADLTPAMTAWDDLGPDSGWYLASGTVTIPTRVTVTGTVHLILEDDASLTVSQGIAVTATNSLTIYAQSTGAAMGQLTATGTTYSAGIGGSTGGGLGSVTVNGGIINTTGGDFGAGLGGGYSGNGGNITINGGDVSATGGDHGAGLGGGYTGDGGNITINGGDVSATGGNEGAGIGGGGYGNGGTIAVSGGTVTALGGDMGAGTGSGLLGTGGDITISGGNVTTVGGVYAAGLGGGYLAGGGNITINGGTVEAICGSNTAGIGAGLYGTGENVVINRGTVRAQGVSAAISTISGPTSIALTSYKYRAATDPSPLPSGYTYYPGGAAFAPSDGYTLIEIVACPTSPVNFVATPGDGYADLTWDLPADYGGSAISGYQVSADNGVTWQTVTGTSYQFIGLTNGQGYSFLVRAVNADSDGPAVTATAVPLGVPRPPLNFRATPGDRQAQLYWNPPVDDGGSAITDYQVSCDGGTTWELVPFGVFSYMCVGLTNGQDYTFLVRAVNAVGDGQSTTVHAAPRSTLNGPALVLDFLSDSDVPVGTVYTRAVSYSYQDGSGTLVFSATGLPTGLSINPVTGVISGTATVIGVYQVTVTSTDGDLTASRSFELTVTNATPQGPSLTLGWLGDDVAAVQEFYTKAVPYNYQNGPGPLVFGAAGLAPGLSIDPATGVISGTPTAAGAYPITVTVTDGNLTDIAQFVLTVNAAPPPEPYLTLDPLTDDSIYAGDAYTKTPTWQYTGTGTLVFTVTGLPTGLDIDPATGEISGSTGWVGTYTVVVTVADLALIDQGSYELTVAEPPAEPSLNLDQPSDATIDLGSSYTETPTFSYDGPGTLVFSAVGLPDGLSINPATGVISGTPTTSGTFTITLTVTDGELTAEVTYHLIIQIPASDPPDPTDPPEPTATSSDNLPPTGSVTPLWVILAPLVLVGAGAGLIRAARRRAWPVQ